jgi:hypothetical protein
MRHIVPRLAVAIFTENGIMSGYFALFIKLSYQVAA